MDRAEALEWIADGHGLMTVEKAKEVVEHFGLKWSDRLIMKWKNQQDANPTNDPKGLWLFDKNKAGEGVATGRLSAYVVNQLGLDVRYYMGRGFQAQANARAVEEYLKEQEVAHESN